MSEHEVQPNQHERQAADLLQRALRLKPSSRPGDTPDDSLAPGVWGNRTVVGLLSVILTIVGFVLIGLSRLMVDAFWKDLTFGIGLALTPSGVIGFIGDYFIFGRTMETLNESNISLGAQVQALRVSTDFLKQSSDLGLEIIYTEPAPG